MSENESGKEKVAFEIIKVVFNYTYDLSLAGHNQTMLVDEYYSLAYPSGLEIGLDRIDEQGNWGHWSYDSKTNKKKWIEVDIPKDPRVKVIDVDGQFIEMRILLDKWLETHENTDSDECREFVRAGLLDFLTRTNQA